MRRAIIYTRVSTEDQAKEGVSLENQLLKCRMQAELLEMEIIKEISDAGKSAKSIKGREGLCELISIAKAKGFDAIIIYKLDRLTRNVQNLGELVEIFNANGISLISVKDSIDTLSAAGRMVLNMLATIAQWERETAR